VALRFLRFILAMLLWGGGVYLTWIAPSGVATRLRARLALLPTAVAAGLVVVTALQLPVVGASFGDGWSDAARLDSLAAVLQTSTGTAWLVDALLSLVLVANLFLGRIAWPASTAFAGLVLVASAMTGHAAAGVGGSGAIHRLSDILHLVAAGFWLGALPPLALTLRHEGAGPEALRAVRRFAVAGQVAVAVVLGTGVGNAILIKGGTPLRWSSAYDLLFLLKLTVVAGMISLACLNHFRLMPRIATGSNGAAWAMRRSVLFEIALGTTALGLVAILGTLDPT
jgi:putative copper resistance protein D